MYKSMFFGSFVLMIMLSFSAKAQLDMLEMDKLEEPANNSESTGYISDYIGDLETQNKAKDSAREVLDSNGSTFGLRDSQLRMMRENKNAREAIRKMFIEREQKMMTQKEKAEKIISQLQPAPLGLYWGASIQQTKDIGFNLSKAQREGYQNVFNVQNPQQKNSLFSDITVIFGAVDKMWCIFAQSKPIEDEPNGEQTLRTYKKYYEALKVKYGNAEEHFTPYTYVEEIETGEGKNVVISKQEKTNPMGGENFLSELQNNQAVLYATFNNGKIGVTLGVFVDENLKGHITIDYKNFEFMQQETEVIVDEL